MGSKRGVHGRLMIGFGVILLIMVGAGVINLAQQDRLGDRAKAMTVRDLEPLAALRETERLQDAYVRSGILSETIRNPEAVQRFKTSVANARANIPLALQRLRDVAPDEMEADVDRLIESWSAFQTTHEARQAATAANDPKAVELDKRAAALSAQFQQANQALADRLMADSKAQSDAINDLRRESRIMTILVLAVAGLVAFSLATWMARKIRRPIDAMVAALERVAAGDLTIEISVHTKDELGRMAEALRTALSSVRTLVSHVAGSAGDLANASGRLSRVSAQIGESAATTSGRAEEATSAAAGVSGNVHTVATGSEEMGASIQAIAQSAQEASNVGAEAVAAAQSINQTIEKLGVSSSEIGNVVKVITSIAEQTNLLALNATIEAARASDAGKGFAVVATEVKDLAQETAKATEDISRRVEAIQADTLGAVDSIGQIGQIIDRINAYQTTIAAAVEEQAATANEMSRSVAEAASGSQEIADAINGVAAAATTTTDGVAETRQAADELRGLSGQLQELVNRFRY